MLLTSAVISGLGLGSMYGLIALGFHVTYVVSNTVNFSQGSAMMLGAVLGYTFAVTLGWPLPLAAMTALAACALAGAVIERTLVRPFAERGSNDVNGYFDVLGHRAKATQRSVDPLEAAEGV